MSSEVLYPLSSPQHAVWLDQSLAPGLPCCNIGAVVQLDGPLDPGRFEAAVEHVIRTNDVLRVVLEQGESDCLQRFPEGPGSSLQRLDFSHFDDAEPRAWAHLKQVFGTPFDLYGGRLWSTQLVDVKAGRALWLLRFHHLVADGMSVSLFANAVVDAYNRLMRGEPPGAEGEEASYRDFVARDGEYFSSSRYAKDREFWFERFAQLPEPLFDGAQKVGSDRPCGQVVWQLDRLSYQRLSEVAAAEGGSSTHFLMAVLAAYFSRVFDRSDEVVIGMPVHNRIGAVQRRTIGMFSSAIPVGIRVDPEQPFTRILQDVAAELKRCYRHQRFPLTDIHRHLLSGVSDRRGLFDVSLSVEGFVGDLQFDDDVRSSTQALHNGYERQPLGIFVRDYEQKKPVYIEFNFDPDVLELEEVRNHVRRIERLTLAAIDAPGAQVLALPVMDDAERVLVTQTFNATRRADGDEALVHQLFERQAALGPEAVALEFEGQRLGYAALNARANQLAHHLRELGVRPDDRVAICLERGPELVVAIVAALKAGAAYVPLDP
ncbi:MAG TPA: condensation domain-containing protein, partial [Duganella sp.]|nr:condensation domain-containing protein [Duganella sp.]